jgi:hypothetical protein
MCLPNFIRFEEVPETNPITGYRIWRLKNYRLFSDVTPYEWTRIVEGPHKVERENSGIYAYSKYTYMIDDWNPWVYDYCCYKYFYDYCCHKYYSQKYYSYRSFEDYSKKYRIAGIIHQYGNTAIHENGQRSEYAKIVRLFSIRESDSIKDEGFMDWIRSLNRGVEALALRFSCEVQSLQNFLEEQI